jgi:hypothetical protein
MAKYYGIYGLAKKRGDHSSGEMDNLRETQKRWMAIEECLSIQASVGSQIMKKKYLSPYSEEKWIRVEAKSIRGAPNI